MLIVIGWIIGIVCVFVGCVWLYFNLILRPLHLAEVELMKRDGKFEGDPDWVQEFNVVQSEWDLQANTRNRYIATGIIVAGVLTLSSLIARAMML